MTIKTGRIRRKFDEALQNGIISDNMLLMAVSALNNEICFNDKLTNKQVAVYQQYRSTIAKTAIDNGIAKSRITEVMQTLSPERYPSPQQITQLITLIQNRSYNYKADYIPDSDMKYKTATEIQDQQQAVIKRNQAQIEHEKQFNVICDYISKQFNISPITADMQAKLNEITVSNDIVLQALKWYTDEIQRAISGKQFSNSFDRFSYILGVIKKKIPDTIAQIEKDQKFRNWLFDENAKAVLQYIEKSGESFEIALEQSILNQCDRPDEKRNGSYDYVRKELLEAIERVKQMKAEEEKQEQEIESPQEIESVVIADNDSAKINKNDNDPKNKPIIERIRLLVNGEYLLIDQKYEIAKKEIREMISYLKCEVENKSNDMQKQKKLQQDLDFCDEYECKINNKHDIELCPFLADDYEEEEW